MRAEQNKKKERKSSVERAGYQVLVSSQFSSPRPLSESQQLKYICYKALPFPHRPINQEIGCVFFCGAEEEKEEVEVEVEEPAPGQSRPESHSRIRRY